MKYILTKICLELPLWTIIYTFLIFVGKIAFSVKGTAFDFGATWGGNLHLIGYIMIVSTIIDLLGTWFKAVKEDRDDYINWR